MKYPSDCIFVFGSNLAGRHGKGAAKYALENYGAVYGKGEGLQGQSYALPTKDENLKSLNFTRLREGFEKLQKCMDENPDKLFIITPVGCGLAGNNPQNILEMVCGTIAFKNSNYALSNEWLDHI